MPDASLPTRKDFLMTVAAAIAPAAEGAQAGGGKLLLAAAHPDDEYAFAGSVYRLVRECGWTADQVVITNGESGYRYASLAESYYGAKLDGSSEGRSRLAEIRKKETRQAGRILGIRRHYFLDQRDLGFGSEAASAESGNWDRPYVRTFLEGLMARERYDAVFTLLPTAETHGHHRAATLLALEAASRLESGRPLMLGVESRADGQTAARFEGLAGEPLTRTAGPGPAIVFDRETPFGFRESLNYGIVVNWLIAEHKSQGLFQNDAGRERYEEFWMFEASGEGAPQRLAELQRELKGARGRAAA